MKILLEKTRVWKVCQQTECPQLQLCLPSDLLRVTRMFSEGYLAEAFDNIDLLDYHHSLAFGVSVLMCFTWFIFMSLDVLFSFL